MGRVGMAARAGYTEGNGGWGGSDMLARAGYIKGMGSI